MRKFAFGMCLLATGVVGCGSAQIIYDTVTPASTQMLDAGQSLTISAQVYNDPSNAGVNWSVLGTGTLSNASSTSVVYTAPATVTTGTTASVKAIPVKNALYAASTQIILAAGPAITTAALPAGVIGTTYSLQVIATGGSAPNTFTVTSGSLPAGLALSSSGYITGTPTTAATSTFTVTLTDSAVIPVTVSKSYTITVTGAPIVITTTSAPNAVSGTPYSAQFALTGGVAPYTWAIASGALPTGLTLSSSGLLSGTTTALGSFTFTVQVTDTEPTPQTVKKTYGITVYPQLNIVTTTLPAASVNSPWCN